MHRVFVCVFVDILFLYAESTVHVLLWWRYLQLAKLKIQLYVTYNDKTRSSAFKRSYNVFKSVCALSLPAFRTFVFVRSVNCSYRVSVASHICTAVVYFVHFVQFSMACTLFCAKNGCVSNGQEETSRNRKSFLFVRLHYSGRTWRPCHACFRRKYTASIVAELDKFVFFLFKPGQLNIVDSLVTVGNRIFLLKFLLQLNLNHHLWAHSHHIHSYSFRSLLLSSPCWNSPRLICPIPFFRSFFFPIIFCGLLLTNLSRVFTTEVLRTPI